MNTRCKNCIDLESRLKRDISRLDKYDAFAIKKIAGKKISALQTYKEKLMICSNLGFKPETTMRTLRKDTTE